MISSSDNITFSPKSFGNLWKEQKQSVTIYEQNQSSFSGMQGDEIRTRKIQVYAHSFELLTKYMKHMVYFTEKDKSMPTEKCFSLNKISLF